MFVDPKPDLMDTYIFPNNKISLAQRQKRRHKRLAEELIECRRYCGGVDNEKLHKKEMPGVVSNGS